MSTASLTQTSKPYQKTIMSTSLETRQMTSNVSPEKASNNAISHNDTMETSVPTTNEAASQIANHSYASVLTSLVSSFRWSPTSEEDLELSETKLLSVLKRPFKTYFVDIGPLCDLEQNRIRTIEIEPPSDADTTQKQPLVLIHGFGVGIGGWILNLDELSTSVKRKIYAFDIPGFARSSRPTFDLKGDVEAQFVDAIEKWRASQGINKFIILGHSFGGYLSAGYALRYPERVSHVIMADPWGVQDRQLSRHGTSYMFPIWVRGINKIFQYFAPLAVIRATGPYGPHLIHKFRADLKEKFRPKLHDECGAFLDYIYHCNAQKASGELAFKALTLQFGWPKFPLINRLKDINESVNLTFLYGSRSWIESEPGALLREQLGPDRVTVNIIQGSGHHVYADKCDEFNRLVTEACQTVSN